MKKSLIIGAIVIIVATIVLGTGFLGFNFLISENDNAIEKVDGELIQMCPDEWIDNQQPCGCPIEDLYCEGCQGNRDYFIFNGERRELGEFDVSWVLENCNLEKLVVY